MAIPKWHEFMAPVLQVLSGGVVRDRAVLGEAVADLIGLSADERVLMMNERQTLYQNRMGWGLSHLTRAGALSRPERGRYTITDLGRQLLTVAPTVTRQDVERITGFKRVRVKEASALVAATADEASAEELDPVEQIETGIARIQEEVGAELLARLHAREPAFFEQAVLDLLMAMGYGGAEGTATRTQLSKDGGIDGVIDQDALGLSRVYVQAKRYQLDSSVGRPDIQAFVGALLGNSANQGVFITTARFSAGAKEYAAGISTRVVLIDGPRLASLMIRYGVGVQVKRTVKIVEIDEDFFE